MATEERLDKLERKLAAVKAREAGAVPKTIRAHAFILEDGHGKPRGLLRVDEDGPGLGLCDENGKLRWSSP